MDAKLELPWPKTCQHMVWHYPLEGEIEQNGTRETGERTASAQPAEARDPIAPPHGPVALLDADAREARVHARQAGPRCTPARPVRAAAIRRGISLVAQEGRLRWRFVPSGVLLLRVLARQPQIELA